MVKKKSVWYIMVRAFREKMKGLRARVVRAVESKNMVWRVALAFAPRVVCVHGLQLSADTTRIIAAICRRAWTRRRPM
jgi:hypothetical protein